MKRSLLHASLLLTVLLLAPIRLRAQQQASALDQAKSEAAAGHYDRAAQLYQQVLNSDPNNVAALSGLSDALVATGHWRDALPALQHLNQLEPNDPNRLFQLGQMESWEGNRTEALALLNHSTQIDPSNVQHQEYYAEVLSWNADTRPKAAKIFEHALQLAPNDVNLLISYAEMLSWNSATRAQSMDYYKKALAQDPHNTRALVGEAQLLSWSGHSADAMQIYSQVLSQDPNNVAALRGEAQIAGWRGEHHQALNLAQQAHALDSSDATATLELAQAEYDLGHYSEARNALAQVKGIDTPDYHQLKHNVDHALGSYFELGYAMRRDGRRLDYDAADALVSTPLGTANRLTAMYQPQLYRTQQRNFNSNYYALMLDSQPSESVTTHMQVAGRTYPGVPSQIEGTFAADFMVRPSLKLQVGFERAADQETLVSTLGADASGIFVGQVETNLASIEADYSNSAHHFDLSLNYTDGLYTGENLASNRRWSVDGNIGKSIRGDHPYIRAAYGFTYLSFDHDAEFEPADAQPPRITGGYYSPTRFLLNYAQLTFSGSVGTRAKWDFGGFAGAQNAQTAFTSFSDPKLASTFNAHFTVEASANNEFRLGYDYLNTFNAFHRHLFFATWRHYF